MQCSVCQQHTPDAWTGFVTYEHRPDAPFPMNRGALTAEFLDQQVSEVESARYFFAWMRCANPRCRQLTVRVSRDRMRLDKPPSDDLSDFIEMLTPSADAESWLAVPRRRLPPIAFDEREVGPGMVGDYAEAWAILDISPRMSAVLSRRMLAEILRKHAQIDQYSLGAQLQTFVEDVGYPRRLREAVHYLQKMGDFGAHEQRSDQAEVIDVDEVEAIWTLEVVAELLNHFVVTPGRDANVKASFDEKLRQANRPPIQPLPPDRETTRL